MRELAATFALAVLVCGCAQPAKPSNPLFTTPRPSYNRREAVFDDLDPAGALAGLLVEPEHSGDGYQRELFDHWIDADQNGCDTRCEVLAAERRADLPGLKTGWYSLYDGYTTDQPTELEVDHVVALAEAWQSGADTWTTERRRAFANDLEHPDALIAVSTASNQSKADRDAASWQPPNPEAACWWASAVIEVKFDWRLSVDPNEATALTNLLQTC